MKNVLSYIASVPNRPLWYISAQNCIVDSNIRYPKLDVLTRGFILHYLRTPKDKTEKACENKYCESERLGGFRIRILGIQNNNWCYLCHLFYTNSLYIESHNRKNPNEREFQINFFCVLVDVPGEYALSSTLMGAKDIKGLYGPFPAYNVRNYRKVDLNNGCKGFIESDTMVFRHSQTTPLDQTKSICTTQLDTGKDFSQ